MDAIPINNIEGEKVVTQEGATKRIKRFLAKIIKADLIDIDAILKSEEWPYLWRK